MSAILIIILLIWGISVKPSHVYESARNIKHIFGVPRGFVVSTSVPTASPKCNLSKICPVDHFAFQITSGGADIVGPKICFEGRNVMSGVLNNVGTGLNIVLVNGEHGQIESFGYLNMIHGKEEDILAFLKNIKPGMIVLVASFDDVTKKMTNEMRDIFSAHGSTMIYSLKHRDNWVFAGGAGSNMKSPFEKLAPNDPKTNVFEGWPEMVGIGGCFPRKI